MHRATGTMPSVVTVALSIAGSDPSGGAGIQADLKTFHQHGVYGCAAITLLTVQNTLGVQRVELVASETVGAQVDAVVDDLKPSAIKTGALGSAAIIARVAESVRRAGASLVIDPVGMSKNQRALTDDGARDVLLRDLLPLSALITPNLDEARWLTGILVVDDASAQQVAQRLFDHGARAVLIKGGHRSDAPIDRLYLEGTLHTFTAPRIDTPHTHGVGCSLSAAITARLACGASMVDAVRLAKRWITEAIAHAPQLGQGQGPIDHFAKIPL